MDEERPSRIGKYEVEAVLGHGGMGIVYKGRDTLSRPVAIKMVLASYANEPELLKRFQREAQFTANLHHPNIVTVYDWGQEGDAPYIVMEYLDGRSLDRWQIDGPPAMMLLKKLNIIAQVCAGLKYAHDRKIVHRDIKPANIFVLDDDSVKLMDFGVARLSESSAHAMTRTGQLIGSLHYMSPEQATGAKLDHRTDIFSLGVVLFQLLSGELPFAGSDTASTIVRIMTCSPRPLSDFMGNCPAELEEVVRKALEKSPRDRYQSAEEMAFDLSLVETRLRREIGGHYLESAEAAMARADWGSAKEILLELLKLDREHARALDLLREVQQIVRRQERAYEAAQLKTQAEEALEKRRFKDAFDLAEEAVKIDNSNLDLAAFRNEVRASLNRVEKARVAIERAENSLHTQQLEAAQDAVREAISLDPRNSAALQLQSRISQALTEQRKRSQVQVLTQQASHELAERRYASALQLLQNVEALDAHASGLYTLFQQAIQGQEREQRERELEALCYEIRALIFSQDVQNAQQRLSWALGRFPDEPQLLDLEQMLVQQRELEEQAARKREQEARAAKDRFRATAPTEEVPAPEFSEYVPTVEWEVPSAPLPPAPIQTEWNGEKDREPESPATGLKADFYPPQEQHPTRRWMPWALGAAAAIGVSGLAILYFGHAGSNPAPAPALVAVNVVTAPAGASVHIEGNGQSQDCVSPQCALSLPPGSYTLRAALPGYSPLSQNLNAAAGMDPVRITLQPQSLSGPLSNPESAAKLIVQTPGVQDAMVLIDGTAYATSGAQLSLNGTLRQSYRVHVEKDGYEPSSEQVVTLAHPTETVVIRLKQLPTAATLQLHNATPHADLLVDGKDVGTVDANGSLAIKVVPGLHALQLASGGRMSNAISRQFTPRGQIDISSLSIPPLPAPQPAVQPKPQPAPQPVDTTAQDWAAIQSTSDGNQLNTFLQRHPSGPYADKARARMEELDWEQTTASNDRARLQAYLQRHGSGGHAQQAREQLEQIDWNAAKNSGDEKRLQGFLNTYPQGKNAGAARTLLQTIHDTNAQAAKKAQDEANARKNQETIDTARNRQAADERAVEDLLGSYKQAYENRNIDQLRRIWPTMSKQQEKDIQNTFHLASSIHMNLQVKPFSITGDSAKAECVQSMQIVAGGNKQTVSNSATFSFQRQGGVWVIQNISYGKAR